MVREEIRKSIAQAVHLHFGKIEIPDFSVEVPENPEHGDYATNVALLLAKQLKKPPTEVAQEINDQLSMINYHTTVASPGFINFWISEKFLLKSLAKVLQKPETWGQSNIGKGQTIVVEYSSPNIAKPLGVHHLRSTIIGQAIINLLRACGYRAVSLSFPGDWGTQFGLLIAAYKQWGDLEKIRQHPIDEMLNLYVRYSQAAKEDPRLLEEGRREFKKLEEGDPENRKLWKWFLDESLRDFEKVYQLLGVKIEHTIGESFYEPELKNIIQGALDRGLAQRGEDGAVVVPIPGSGTPEIIQKSDGATIYTTRELAAIRHRIKEWKADQILYVAANQQTFHLEQVFRSAELLGYARRGQLQHVKFGMMLGPGGKKFATREGKLIPLLDVLNEAISRSRAVVEKLNPDLPEEKKAEIARIVGIGAVKYFDLSHNRLSDIVFDWESMLNLQGASAPYLQYAHARLKSILRKAGEKVSVPADADFDKLEHLLAVAALRLPETVEDALEDYTPNTLANYLYGLAQLANEFYHSRPVTQAPDPLRRDLRAALVACTALTLSQGLAMLGIGAPEEM